MSETTGDNFDRTGMTVLPVVSEDTSATCRLKSARRKTLPDYHWPQQWLSRRYAPYRWIASGAFRVAYVAGRVASFFACATRRSKKATIAVLRTDGVGDAILFEPTLRKLARRFDDCDIHLWCPPMVALLFEANPAVGRIVTVPRGFKDGNTLLFWSLKWRAKLGWAIGRFAYDLVLYPPRDPEPLGNWLLGTMRSPERWISPGSALNQFDWQREIAHESATHVVQVDEPIGVHELDRNSRFAAAAWDDPTRPSIAKDRPDLRLSARATTYAGVQLGTARHAVRRARANGLVGLVVSGSASINQYPPQKWADVVRYLWEERGLLCALLGTQADQVASEAIARFVADESPAGRPIPLHRFSNDQDIAVAIAIVSKLDGLISVDTALAHAAAAFDLPSVVLATGGMPGRFFPWPAPTRSVTLTKKTPCAGCNYRCTQSEAICVSEIEPRQIADALYRAMKTAKGENVAEKAPARQRRAS